MHGLSPVWSVSPAVRAVSAARPGCFTDPGPAATGRNLTDFGCPGDIRLCGIFGVWYPDGRPVDQRAVERSRDTLIRRGPDDAGTWVKDNFALAHRRLSIIDLSPDGRMPMTSEAGDVWAVFNGEIYNFQELREELIS